MQLILNTGGNLERFRDLFEHLEKKGLGHMKGDHFSVSTDVRLKPSTDTYALFTQLQDEAADKGFSSNCYCFKIKA